jgi:hypothetical protein
VRAQHRQLPTHADRRVGNARTLSLPHNSINFTLAYLHDRPVFDDERRTTNLILTILFFSLCYPRNSLPFLPYYLSIKTLTYLDDRPIFDDERLTAEAFMAAEKVEKGSGKAAEKAERVRQKEEKVAKEERQHAQFQELVNDARARKAAALAAAGGGDDEKIAEASPSPSPSKAGADAAAAAATAGGDGGDDDYCGVPELEDVDDAAVLASASSSSTSSSSSKMVIEEVSSSSSSGAVDVIAAKISALKTDVAATLGGTEIEEKAGEEDDDALLDID